MKGPKSVVVLLDDDEDDCVVLDDDPDKPRMVENGYGDNSDDLVVVSEKGEVACRDFPHPRHICAKYPFSSSRHEMHCDQCHCYVCDSIAPCVGWGTGVSKFDHCHATDEIAIWKSRRRFLKKFELPSPIPVHNIATSMRTPPMSVQSSALVPNRVPQNQGSRQLETTVNSVSWNRGRPCLACSFRSVSWNRGRPCMACSFNNQ